MLEEVCEVWNVKKASSKYFPTVLNKILSISSYFLNSLNNSNYKHNCLNDVEPAIQLNLSPRK